jgi:hypothetical protein
MSPAARRRYRRYLGRQPRFLIATILTIVVVAFVVVPWVASLVDALGTYGPAGYEPKDFKRGEFQRRLTDPASWTGEHLFNLGLFVLLAVVWYLSLSGGRPGSHSR